SRLEMSVVRGKAAASVHRRRRWRARPACSSLRCLCIVVYVRTARKQARLGQSGYIARKTKLLHGAVVERRKTTKEKDLLPSRIILRRGDGVESSPTCWPAAFPSSSSCLGCCLAWHRPSRSLGSCDR